MTITNPTPQDNGGEMLQNEFEAWMASSNYPEIADIALERLPDGTYKSQLTFAAWQAWQGARHYLLAKALEGADEKLAEIRERNGKEGFAVSDRATLLTLVTALSAKLTTQKAAHTKMLRDEAKIIRAEESAYAAEHLFRMADKIEGGE